MIGQRQRAGAGGHVVGGIDVGLEDHRHAVQSPRLGSLRQRRIPCLGNPQRRWIGFDYRVERRIDDSDAFEEGSYRLAGGEPAGGDGLAQLDGGKQGRIGVGIHPLAARQSAAVLTT